MDALTVGELIRQHKYTLRQFTFKLAKLYYNVEAACKENGELDEEEQQQLKELKQRIKKLMAFVFAAELNLPHHANFKLLEGNPKAAFEDQVRKRYQEKEEAFDKYIEELKKLERRKRMNESWTKKTNLVST